MQKERVLITGVKRYSFEDRDTGEVLKGCNVYYTPLEGEKEDNLLGAVMLKTNLPYEQYSVFEHGFDFPCLADMNVTVSLSGRKPQLKVSGFDFVKSVSIKSIIDYKQATPVK